MAYLGRGLDKISNIEVLDNITFDGSSSYSITKGSVAFAVNSAQSLLISIDGVVQATNFSVNSSTIDFGVAIPSTSVCNFFLHYGTGVMTVPSDGSVTEAKIGSNAVSSAKMFSGFKNGITMTDSWRTTADTAFGTNAVVSSNWEQVDETRSAEIGTALSESSGVFTLPQTGIYFIYFSFQFNLHSDASAEVSLEFTDDNSSFSGTSEVNAGNNSSSLININSSNSFMFGITDTSNQKFRFSTVGFASNTKIRGDTNSTESGFSIIRLGDSV